MLQYNYIEKVRKCALYDFLLVSYLIFAFLAIYFFHLYLHNGLQLYKGSNNEIKVAELEKQHMLKELQSQERKEVKRVSLPIAVASSEKVQRYLDSIMRFVSDSDGQINTLKIQKYAKKGKKRSIFFNILLPKVKTVLFFTALKNDLNQDIACLSCDCVFSSDKEVAITCTLEC